MKKEESMRNINPFGLRMQPDLKAKVEEAAARNHRSLNAEIVARLEDSFRSEQAFIAVDEFHIPSQTAAHALELIDSLKAELLAMTGKPKENAPEE